jgi:hypothetical protein
MLQPTGDHAPVTRFNRMIWMVWMMVFLGGLAFAAAQAVAWGGVTLVMERNFQKAAHTARIAAGASLILVWGLWLISEALALLQFIIYA